jgi:hypothetical protein
MTRETKIDNDIEQGYVVTHYARHKVPPLTQSNNSYTVIVSKSVTSTDHKTYTNIGQEHLNSICTKIGFPFDPQQDGCIPYNQSI